LIAKDKDVVAAGSETIGRINSGSSQGDRDAKDPLKAVALITAIVRIASDRSNTNPNSNWYLTYTGGSTFSTSPAQRWLIAGGDVSTGGQFNVMVIGP